MLQRVIPNVHSTPFSARSGWCGRRSAYPTHRRLRDKKKENTPLYSASVQTRRCQYQPHARIADERKLLSRLAAATFEQKLPFLRVFLGQNVTHIFSFEQYTNNDGGMKKCRCNEKSKVWLTVEIRVFPLYTRSAP